MSKVGHSIGRRSFVKTAAGAAAVAGIGAPAILRAQSDVIKVGHLTPLTGFLGPIGEYAVMGVKLAVDEVNAAGGVLGRKIELLTEDSVNPSTASTKAQRMIERGVEGMIEIDMRRIDATPSSRAFGAAEQSDLLGDVRTHEAILPQPARARGPIVRSRKS